MDQKQNELFKVLKSTVLFGIFPVLLFLACAFFYLRHDLKKALATAKYQDGECAQSASTGTVIYIYNAGTLIKGVYTVLTEGHDNSLTRTLPREVVESQDFSKVHCPNKLIEEIEALKAKMANEHR